MIPALAAALILAAVALLARAVYAKSREQEAAVAAILNADWDDWAGQVRSDTPIHDALLAETFRRQLDEGWTE